MESTLSQVLAPSELAPVNGKGATPFAQQTVVLTKQAYIELTWQANYWRAQYEQPHSIEFSGSPLDFRYREHRIPCFPVAI